MRDRAQIKTLKLSLKFILNLLYLNKNVYTYYSSKLDKKTRLEITTPGKQIRQVTDTEFSDSLIPRVPLAQTLNSEPRIMTISFSY